MESGPDAGGRFRSAFALLAWVAALAAVICLLDALGRGRLATPPLLEARAWGPWASARDPLEAVFAVLRVVVMAVAWYLLAVTALGGAARTTRAAGLVAVADVVTVPVVRRLLHGALGLGLATATLTSGGATTFGHVRPVAAAVAFAQDGWAERATMRRIDAGSPSTDMRRPRTEALPELPADHPTLIPPSRDGHAVGGGGRTAHRPGDVVPGDGPASLRARAPAPPETPSPADGQAPSRRWQVMPGQHLWGIAEHVLADAWGRQPTAREVGPYWRRLVEGNRDALADPANPDLVYPGQRFAIPAPPQAP